MVSLNIPVFPGQILCHPGGNKEQHNHEKQKYPFGKPAFGGGDEIVDAVERCGKQHGQMPAAFGLDLIAVVGIPLGHAHSLNAI